MQGRQRLIEHFPGHKKEAELTDAKNFLSEFKRNFDPVLEEYLKVKIDQTQEISKDAVVPVNELLRVAKNGGKRLRPMFVYAGYISAGGKAYNAALLASLSVELLHIFATIHDDIIDNSDLRRGKPTTHKIFEQLHKNWKFSGDPKRFGLSAAILAGDLATTFADEILNIAPFPHERIRKAKFYFNKMKQEAEFGEYLDVLYGFKNRVSEDEVLKVLEYKTGKYTVERPLHIGAALTGADPDLYEAFTTYALPFGQAFQTQDDIMGTFGDEEEIGKPTDSDIKEGKKTLLVVKALEMASKQQKNLLKRVLGNNYANESEIEMVRVVFRETGALSYAVSLSEYLLDRAKETIASSKIEDTGKQYLIAAADYLQARKL